MRDPILPAVPGLEPAFTIRAQVGEALSGGMSPKGERLHIPITGGTVEGPLFAGTVLPGGSDWPLIRQDGTSEISARYTVQADDGTLVEVRNEGLRVSSPDVLARLRAGVVVDPADYYFRAAPVFHAPDGAHGWMNDTLFIASICRDGPDVVIAVYRVT